MLIVAICLTFFAFSLYQPTESSNSGNENVDAYIEASCKCFFHILCKLEKPMEIKTIVEEFLPTTLHVIDDLMKKISPPSILAQYGYNYDKLISEEFWKQDMFKMVCKSFTEDDRYKMRAAYAGPLVDHFKKECSTNKNTEICAALNKVSVVYNEVAERYKVQCAQATASLVGGQALKAAKSPLGK